MSNEQLYIDGVLMDIDDNTKITLDIKSNLFRSVADMVSNSTYTIKLPKTVHNLTVVGNIDTLAVNSSYAYTQHACRYLKDGVEVIKNGKAYVMRISTTIEISIVWGIIEALSNISDNGYTLQDLNISDTLTWNGVNVPDPKEWYKEMGYFYAYYNPFQYRQESSWQAQSYYHTKEETFNIDFKTGAIATGQSLGEQIKKNIDVSKTGFVCAAINVLSGDIVELKNIIGGTNERAYAILDSENKVIELAEAPRQSNSTHLDTSSMPQGAFFEAGVKVWNVFTDIHSIAIRITSIGIILQGNDSSLQVGYVDKNGRCTPVTTTGVITAGVWTEIKVDFTKPADCDVYVYSEKMCLCRAPYRWVIPCYTQDSDGNIEESFASTGLFYQLTYDSEVYTAEYYKLTMPSNAASLVLNHNKGAASLEMTATRTTYTPDSVIANQSDVLTYYLPSVTMQYVLKHIANTFGLNINWASAVNKNISTLALPLVTLKPAETTSGKMVGTFMALDLDVQLPLSVTESSGVFKEGTGTEQEFTAVADVDAIFDIQVTYSYTTRRMQNMVQALDSPYTMYPSNELWLIITVKHTDKSDDDTYTTINDKGQTYLYSYQITDKRGKYTMQGYGKIPLKAGDKLSIMCKGQIITDTQYVGNNYYNDILTDVQFISGRMTVITSSEQVARGGSYPIRQNMPEVAILDTLKCLQAITGTFPKQDASSCLQMADINAIWENKPKALNWSNRLIAMTNENKPRQLEYKVSDFAQRNTYKWKEDKANMQNHDGTMVIDNETLDAEKNVITFPFAASDGDRIPVFTPDEGTRNILYQGSDDNYKAPEYKGCEPRIMRIYDYDDGRFNKTALQFDDTLDMQNILNSQYKNVNTALNQAKVIKEYLYLSDSEVVNFDETIPVYLAQYGAYFAVLEIKVNSKGYSEVTMIKI